MKKFLLVSFVLIIAAFSALLISDLYDSKKLNSEVSKSLRLISLISSDAIVYNINNEISESSEQLRASEANIRNKIIEISSTIPLDKNSNYEGELSYMKLCLDLIEALKQRNETYLSLEKAESFDFNGLSRSVVANISYGGSVSNLSELLDIRDLAYKKINDLKKGIKKDEDKIISISNNLINSGRSLNKNYSSDYLVKAEDLILIQKTYRPTSSAP